MRLWLPGGECAHLVKDFCRHANLYARRNTLLKVATGTPGWAVTVTDAAAIGRADWADVARYCVPPRRIRHDHRADER